MSELNQAQTPKNAKNGKKMLLILAVIFVLPFTLAATLHLLNLKPSGHSYGNLIQPLRALQFPSVLDAQGKEFGAPRLQKKWSIVMLEPANCAQTCETTVHLLKQIQISLNKDSHRVQRVLLMPSDVKIEAKNALQKQDPDLIILAGSSVELAKFAANFDVAGAKLYLVDPLGNLMMSYPESIDPKGMFTDLKRLLKNSWAG
jgi:cytochrome oxidase Cu insertion factor (SCO1/SenC/PrrC family)